MPTSACTIRFEIISAVLLKIKVVWNGIPCELVNTVTLHEMLDQEGGGSTYPQNVSGYFPVNTV
jgi:hypothetical protein